nr:copia protein [Tanacetum cinerariifolium]
MLPVLFRLLSMQNFLDMGVDHLIKDCNFHSKPKPLPTPRNSAHRGYDKHYASSTKKYPQKHIVPATVLTKSKPVSVTAARPVSAVVPKIMATKPRHARSLHTKTNSIIKRHKTRRKFSKTSNSSPKVTAAHAKVGIKKEFSVPRTPQKNGIAERKNRTLIEAAKTTDYLLPITFWAKAVNTACYVQNRVLVTKPQNKTPYELLHGRTPSIGFMRPFRCPVTILNALDSLGKFGGKVDEGFLVGYSVNNKAFRVFNSRNQSEDIVYYDHENVGTEADFNNLENSITVSPIPTTRIHDAHPISQIIGHTQEEGINYEEVFAPVARIEAIRLFLAYASFMGFMVYQMDVKSAFLYGTIEEEVYVCQPPRFEDPDNPDKVYKVVKALYCLHQAPRAWYETLATYLLENGFHMGQIDQTLFIKKQEGDILLVQIYVDDIIFGKTNKDLCKSVKKLMKDKFQMTSMGELTFFMGLQVKQKEDGIFINQDKYVAKILKKFGLTDGKSASTPIDIEKPLLKDPNGKDVDVHIYISMIGSLMYLTSSRPDIMFA